MSGNPQSNPVQQLARVIASLERRSGLRDDDQEWLLLALRVAMFEGASLERALGLPPKWRSRMMAAELRAGVVAQDAAGVDRHRRGVVKEQLQELDRFGFDVINPPAPGERGYAAFKLLCGYGGKVPSYRTHSRTLKLPNTLPHLATSKLADDPTGGDGDDHANTISKKVEVRNLAGAAIKRRRRSNQ
ncbi:MAG: hypothetical protein WB662_03980 [Methyloceanibacter sp.]